MSPEQTKSLHSLIIQNQRVILPTLTIGHTSLWSVSGCHVKMPRNKIGRRVFDAQFCDTQISREMELKQTFYFFLLNSDCGKKCGDET